MKIALRTTAAILGLALGAQAYLPYKEREMKYPRIATWDAKLEPVWAGWKIRFVDGQGLVQGNDPSGAKKVISEGQSYGMMLALWFGDQATFNKIWAGTENALWNSGSGWYKWTQADGNFAGDADIDICGALIFASALVDSGYWPDATVSGTNYKGKAKILLNSIIKNFIDVGSNYRINSWPGAGDGIRNPSYHMPAWYPIFKEFAAANNITGMDWDKAKTGAYALINAQTNSQYGMARNFSNGSGQRPSGGTSSPNNYDMGFDAIRVPYRMGMAAMWYKHAEAVKWCNNVWKNGKVSPTAPGEYSVDNATLIGWTEAQYEKFMTRAMWGTAAVAVQDSAAESKAARDAIVAGMNSALQGDSYLKGENPDTSGLAAPNKNYYAQSLGLLGGLAMAGRAWNVWDDLKNRWVVPDTSTKVVTAVKADPNSIALSTTGGVIHNTTITATLNKPAKWVLSLKGKTSGAQFEATQTSSAISVTWNSTQRKPFTTGKFEVAEQVDVTLLLPGQTAATAPANAKTVITLTGSVGLQQRAVRGEGSVRWSSGALEVRSPELESGVRYRVEVSDLAGRRRDLGTHVAQSGLLTVSVPAAPGIQILQIVGPNGAAVQYVTNLGL